MFCLIKVIQSAYSNAVTACVQIPHKHTHVLVCSHLEASFPELVCCCYLKIDRYCQLNVYAYTVDKPHFSCKWLLFTPSKWIPNPLADSTVMHETNETTFTMKERRGQCSSSKCLGKKNYAALLMIGFKCSTTRSIHSHWKVSVTWVSGLLW